MRTILTFLLALLLSTAVVAKTKWYYNTERTGEGIILTELPNDQVAFAFYSHTALPFTPPVVSPPPPPAPYCDEYTVWLTGLSVFTDKDSMEGLIYYDVAVTEFPVAKDGAVSESVVVGTFYAWRDGDGFAMILENNHLFCDLSIFDVEHHFATVLTE